MAERPPLESFVRQGNERPPLESFASQEIPREDVTAGMALRGIPVLGAYVPQAEAAIRAATGQGEGATFGERYQNILPQREALYRQAEEAAPITSGVLKMGGGMAALGPVGATAAGARALGMAGGLGTRIGYGAASGAGLSAADTLAHGGTPQEALEAGKFGGLVSGTAAPIAAGLSRAITPSMQTDPVRRAAVATLEAQGVRPMAGDVIGSRPVQWAEQHLGELAGRGPERAYEQLTGAAIRNAGFTGATRATPDVIDRAFTRVGNEFDRLAAQTTLTPDQAMGPQLRGVIARYESQVAPPNRIPGIRDFEREIATQLVQNGNTIPGPAYKSLSSRLAADARSTNNPEAKQAYYGLKDALDSAMERDLQRLGSPLAGAWQQIRNQYRNLLVLENAAANPQTKLGLITPSALYSATKSVQGMRNIARGRGNMQELANAASDVMRPLPSSGTAQRSYWQNLPAHIGAGGLAGALYGQGDPWAALGGAAAGLAPVAMGRAITSPLGQAYLRNQLLANPAAHGAFRGGVQGGLLSLQQ